MILKQTLVIERIIWSLFTSINNQSDEIRNVKEEIDKINNEMIEFHKTNEKILDTVGGLRSKYKLIEFRDSIYITLSESFFKNKV
jgi:predicted nucleic acid-binding protein